MLKKSLIIVFSLVTFNLIGQTEDSPKPEFTDLPYAWVKESNELIQLSKETADMKAGMKMSYKYAGPSSEVKISGEKSFSFVVNSTMPATLTSMKLYKLEVKKKFRQVAVVAAGIGKVNMKDENAIDFNSKKISDDDVYEIVLSSKLEKGEYAFTNGMNSYTFSVE